MRSRPTRLAVLADTFKIELTHSLLSFVLAIILLSNRHTNFTKFLGVFELTILAIAAYACQKLATQTFVFRLFERDPFKR